MTVQQPSGPKMPKSKFSETARDGAWCRFFFLLIGAAVSLVLATWAIIVLVDPYDSVFFSPKLERRPIASNQRFSYPSIARSQIFDSAVFGTSTVALLKPEELSAVLGGRFANLSLYSGTAYEQKRVAELFMRSRVSARTIIVGIDIIWCGTARKPDLTKRVFPEWMYDEDPWNDLFHYLSIQSIEDAVRQVSQLRGTRKPKYAQDGFARFLPDPGSYDLDRARLKIYGQLEPKRHKIKSMSLEEREELRNSLVFPELDRLKEILTTAGPETMKVLLFVPYHIYNQPPSGDRGAVGWQMCKEQIVEIARDTGRHLVADFMIPSEITEADSNYWDPLHYKASVAGEIVDALHVMMTEKRSVPGKAELLSIRK